MRNITWLLLPLLFELCVDNICCYDGTITTRFHQNGYKIKDMRIQTISYNEDYFNIFEIQLFQYNGSTCAINCTINIKISTEDKIEALVRGFRFFNNEFRQFPVQMQMNLKHSFDSNAIGMDLKSCGNLTCYFEKDVTYHGCNIIIDETRFPPLIPIGKYKVDIILLYLNEEISHHSIFGELYNLIA